MRKSIGVLTIVLLAMFVLSQSVSNSRAAKEAVVYSTSSVKFDFAKKRFEWEMLRRATPEEAEQVDSFYIDLARGVMGHNGQESKLTENTWSDLVKLFRALDVLTVKYTRTWFQGESPQKETTSGESHL